MIGWKIVKLETKIWAIRLLRAHITDDEGLAISIALVLNSEDNNNKC